MNLSRRMLLGVGMLALVALGPATGSCGAVAWADQSATAAADPDVTGPVTSRRTKPEDNHSLFITITPKKGEPVEIRVEMNDIRYATWFKWIEDSFAGKTDITVTYEAQDSNQCKAIDPNPPKKD